MKEERERGITLRAMWVLVGRVRKKIEEVWIEDAKERREGEI